jgi:hypothetical protein
LPPGPLATGVHEGEFALEPIGKEVLDELGGIS